MACAFGNMMNQPERYSPSPVDAEEDRILRTWTPLMLRTILIVSTIVLIAGIVATILHSPGFFIARFHAVQKSQLHGAEGFATLLRGSFAGDPHAIMTIGLYILTLVPLVRVAFTFVLFLKDRDYIYVAATAYVLSGLLLGMALGRIG
jgi:uncharacterized membrane protein